MLDPGIPETLAECKLERQEYKKCVRRLMDDSHQSALWREQQTAQALDALACAVDEIYFQLGELTDELRKRERAAPAPPTPEQP